MKTFLAALFLVFVLATGIRLEADSVRQEPRSIDSAEHGIGRWIPDIDFAEGKFYEVC